MTSTYIFDRVYERRSTYTKIYGILIAVYVIYVNIGDSRQSDTIIYRMRGGGAMFIPTDKLLIYKTAGE